MGTNRTLRRIRTGVDGTTPVHCVISKTSNPSHSENIGTSINVINRTSNPAPIVISGTSATSPAGGLWIPRIGSIRQSTSPNIKNYDELNASVVEKLSNYPISLPIIT